MSKVSTTGCTEESMQWSDLPNWHTSLRFRRWVEYSLVESWSFREPRFTRSGSGIQPQGYLKSFDRKLSSSTNLTQYPPFSKHWRSTTPWPSPIELYWQHQNRSRSVFTTPISSSWTLSATAMDFDALPVSFRFRPVTPALPVWNADTLPISAHSCPLFCLPKEVRTRIFCYSGLVRYEFAVTVPERDSDSSGSGTPLLLFFPIVLLRSCSRLWREVLKIFYS
jgi:hypothetical protein